MSGARAAFDAAWRQAQQALQRDDASAALAPLRQCLHWQPQQFGLWLQTAVTAFRAGQPRLALELLESAAQRWPSEASVLFHLGYLREMAGDAAAAAQTYRDTLLHEPAHADALRNLGGLLARGGEAAAALDVFQRLLALQPQDRDLHIVVADLALQCGDADLAQRLAEGVVAVMPQHAPAWRTLARAARQRRDLDSALPALRQAVALTPQRAGLVADLGQAQIEAADFDAGVATLRHAATLDPQQRVIAWLEALALPALMLDEAGVDESLARFALQLERLHEELRLDTPTQISAAYEAVCRVLPFPLHYLPRDTRHLGTRFGTLVQRVMRAAGVELAEAPAARQRGGRVRVGFISAELREHTITRYFGRWLEELDGARFERWAWHCGSIADTTSAQLAQVLDQFRHAPLPPLQLAAEIRAAELDAVVFLDVGMDPAMLALAALPLAPRQYLAYGHPVSSGLDGFSGFLSGAALEAEGAAAHYREPLIRLPGIGALPRRPLLRPAATWTPRRGAMPQLLCLQSLAKVIPSFDATLARLAQETGACIGLFTGPAGVQPLERRFLARLGTAFRARGLDPDRHLRLHARTRYATYLEQIAAADLVLDTPGFCGGATSLDTCHVGTPVVTWQGEFLRARQTAGMLRLLDLPQGIATDSDGYIAAAVGLLDDTAANADLRARLRERAPVLFDAGQGLDVLADVLEHGRSAYDRN